MELVKSAGDAEMVKVIAVSQETIDALNELAKKFDVKPEELLKITLEALGSELYAITRVFMQEMPLCVQDKHKRWRLAVGEAISAGLLFYRVVLKPILDHLECSGHCSLEDMSVDDEGNLVLFFNIIPDSPLVIDRLTLKLDA